MINIIYSLFNIYMPKSQFNLKFSFILTFFHEYIIKIFIVIIVSLEFIYLFSLLV